MKCRLGDSETSAEPVTRLLLNRWNQGSDAPIEMVQPSRRLAYRLFVGLIVVMTPGPASRLEPTTVRPRAHLTHPPRRSSKESAAMSEMPTDQVPVAAPEPSRALWGDRSLKTKVLSTVAVSAAVAGTIGVLGLSALGTVADQADGMYRTNLLGVADVGEMDTLLSDMRVNIRDTLLGAAPQKNVAAVDDLAAQFAAATEEYRGTGLDAECVQVLADVTSATGDYVTFQKNVLVPAAQAGDYAGWTAANAAQGAPLAQAVDKGIARLKELETEEADSTAVSIRSSYESQRALSIV